ncbi:MAG: glycogen phosphorylase [Bacillales bacterium]|jgi:starch phosphorylase|nr:glycogen phosphorylase [Bacillales bacterium]
MFADKEVFKKLFTERLQEYCGTPFYESTIQNQYHTLGNMVREHISKKWIETNEKYRKGNLKQVHYISIEFLLGRLLCMNLTNLGISDTIEQGLSELGIDIKDVMAEEIDAGLGTGGLGRLAACFLDSLASLNLPGHGHGIRYKYGLFNQRIVDGYQVEMPETWLKHGNVWEVRRPDQAVEVKYNGEIKTVNNDNYLEYLHENYEVVLAMPYDIPIVGYGSQTVNTLRLWSAEPANYPIQKNLITYKRETEAITEFIYPDDTNDDGKILRLKQQYFLVSATLQNLINSFKKSNKNIHELSHFLSIQINDTHPTLAIPELMRLLMDVEKLGWDEAWDITTKVFNYTNHTIMNEALEKWPIRLFQPLLPRIYMIIEEIHKRFEEANKDNNLEKLSILWDGYVRMANLAVISSNKVNGVAKVHTEILKRRVLYDFYNIYPEKFTNKTNGISHRRWLLKANPQLASHISNAIGTDWITDLDNLKELERFSDDNEYLNKLLQVKRQRKEMLADIILEKNNIAVDSDSIFDIQVKRMHAYKRQLLNVLNIMHLYNKIKDEPNTIFTPRTFIFGAKASPGYYYAKNIIKLIHCVADLVNSDPNTKNLIKVVFLENYCVSLAEKIMPACDISEQISTASKEASGTGNMKFILNGAITVGTLDGANIEIYEHVGDFGMYKFGLTVDEVINYEKYGGYSSFDYYHHDKRIQRVVEQLVNGTLSKVKNEFEMIYDSLLYQNDQYFVLKDFSAYVDIQERISNDYVNHHLWSQKMLTNIANSGYFSSDRTIKEYSDEIWGI